METVTAGNVDVTIICFYAATVAAVALFLAVSLQSHFREKLSQLFFLFVPLRCFKNKRKNKAGDDFVYSLFPLSPLVNAAQRSPHCFVCSDF